MNLSEEYIELMTRFIQEGQKHGATNQVEALILAACYGPEITQAELDLVNGSTLKAMEDLKIPINEMKVNLTSTLVADGFTLQEAKIISGEETKISSEESKSEKEEEKNPK